MWYRLVHVAEVDNALPSGGGNQTYGAVRARAVELSGFLARLATGGVASVSGLGTILRRTSIALRIRPHGPRRCKSAQ